MVSKGCHDKKEEQKKIEMDGDEPRRLLEVHIGLLSFLDHLGQVHSLVARALLRKQHSVLELVPSELRKPRNNSDNDK